MSHSSTYILLFFQYPQLMPSSVIWKEQVRKGKGILLNPTQIQCTTHFGSRGLFQEDLVSNVINLEACQSNKRIQLDKLELSFSPNFGGDNTQRVDQPGQSEAAKLRSFSDNSCTSWPIFFLGLWTRRK